MKKIADEKYLRLRLLELQGWADYLVESLSADQAYEEGKLEVLERVVPEARLSELRRNVRTVSSALESIIAGLEGSARDGDRRLSA